MKALEIGFFAIPTLDRAASKAFYGDVMGWDFNDRDPEFSYIFANGNMIGALELATDQLKPSPFGPLMYFRAESMKETLSKVSAAGGTVVEKLARDGGERGYTAKIMDPSQNTIGFWAPQD